MTWTVLVLLAVLAALVVARLVPGAHEGEETVWRRLMLASLFMTVGAALARVAALVGGVPDGARPHQGGAVPAIVFGAGAVLSAAYAYQGVIHWNRQRTRVADPGDWVNGFGSTLVVAAIGGVVLHHDEGWVSWASVAHHVSLLAFGACFVAAGSAASIVKLGDLTGDPRAWLVTGGLALYLVPTAAGVLAPPALALASQGLVVPGVALFLIAARRRSDPAVQPVSASNRATSNGSLVIVAAALGVLIVNGLNDGMATAATVLAAVATLGVSTRLFRLVRELESLAQAKELAMTDEVTGIANRRALTAALEADLTRGTPVHLLMLNLENFKLVNDRHGHATGDDLLQHLASTLAGRLPRDAQLARLGGSEFTVLLRGATPEAAEELCGTLIGAVRGVREINGLRLPRGGPAGIADSRSIPERPLEETVRELVRRADSAAHRAGDSGIGVFDAETDAAIWAQVQLVDDLAAALDPRSAAGAIVVHYQPQVEAGSGRVAGVEALVRWQHPRLGQIGPDAFIPLAEEHGLMGALTAHVVHTAAAQWHQLRRAGHRLRMSVNLSASCLTAEGLLPLLDDVERDGVDPAQFVIEVTETSVMQDPEAALDTLKTVAARGFPVSIDDYGTGYSSLSYLDVLPATELKIDRSFVQRLTTDERTAAIIAGTIDLAHHLDLRLVAEGVEDEATQDALTRLGCDESQGYYFARPMPGADLERWLTGRVRVPSARGVSQDFTI